MYKVIKSRGRFTWQTEDSGGPEKSVSENDAYWSMHVYHKNTISTNIYNNNN